MVVVFGEQVQGRGAVLREVGSELLLQLRIIVAGNAVHGIQVLAEARERILQKQAVLSVMITS